jgi:hypothetical protein
MRLIDGQYLKTPFYGWPKMTVSLQKAGSPLVSSPLLQQIAGIGANEAAQADPKIL